MTRPAFAFYTAISGSARRFRRLLPRARETQKRRLLALLRRNAGTEIGRRHGFASIRDEREYRARVPVSTYESLRPLIERMARGEPDLLFAGVPLAFEQTGGSSGGAKRIPYNAALLEAFRRALLPWLDDLAGAYPAIASGRAYWSISPVGAKPAGLGGDAAYFGALAPLLEQTLAVSPGVAALPMAQWRAETRRQLAACRDLALISVWSPTFLAELAGENDWPGLRVISCWDQGSSRRPAEVLRERFPGVRVQGKGLLATEGVVSLPLEGLAMPVLAVDSGYFEFVDDAGRCFGAAEVAKGATYQVLMTTEGGLYRYAIGDRVRVHGFEGEAPLLEFLGRAAVSDLCGEKLSEDFVLDALRPLELGFAVLAPAEDRYLLVVDAGEVPEGGAAALARAVEEALSRNPQYAYARRLGQLKPLEPRRRERALEAWVRAGLARGQRLGDIKPPALCARADWAS